MPAIQDRWNTMYSRGDWDYLQHLGEAAHYGVIAGYLIHLPNIRTILDVGCGKGLLRDYLNAGANTHYSGIDCSSIALETARLKWPNANFICANAAEYKPNMYPLFDAIIFNESLYYFRDPILVLERYRAVLSASGVVVISMYSNNLPGQEPLARRITALWQRIEAMPWLNVDETVVENRFTRKQWRIRLLRSTVST